MGDILVKLDYVICYFGVFMFIIESGGCMFEGVVKFYVWWKLIEFVEGEELVIFCCLCGEIVVKVGGDMYFCLVY